MSFQIIGDDWTPPDLFATQSEAETFAESPTVRGDLGNYVVEDVGPLCIECSARLTEDDGRYLCSACCPRMAEIRAEFIPTEVKR